MKQINNLPKKVFKIVVIKMIPKHGRRINDHRASTKRQKI